MLRQIAVLLCVATVVLCHPHEDEGGKGPGCDDSAIRAAIDEAVSATPDDLLAIAKSVQAAGEEGGEKWEVVCAYCEFGYANWYTAKICQHESNGVYCTAWQD